MPSAKCRLLEEGCSGQAKPLYVGWEYSPNAFVVSLSPRLKGQYNFSSYSWEGHWWKRPSIYFLFFFLCVWFGLFRLSIWANANAAQQIPVIKTENVNWLVWALWQHGPKQSEVFWAEQWGELWWQTCFLSVALSKQKKSVLSDSFFLTVWIFSSL